MLKPKASTAAKLVSCVALSAALAFTAPIYAFATPASDAQAQADAALAKLNELNDKVAAAENDYVTAVLEKEAAEGRVDEAQGRIDTATARISELQGKLGGRARSMYRSGNVDILDLLFGCATFKEFSNNWNILERLNQNDADMVVETKTLRAEVESEKAVLVEQQEIARQAEAQAQSIYDEASAAQAEMQATYDSLSEEAAALIAQEQAAKAAAEAQAVQNAQGVATAGDSSNSSSSSSSPSYSSGGGGSAVDRAYSLLGTPYEFGAGGMATFDCSGFVGYCITGSTGHALGGTGSIIGLPQVSASEARPGDIVVNDHHTGLYIGGGMMIHAPQTGDVVSIAPVKGDMIYVRY